MPPSIPSSPGRFARYAQDRRARAQAQRLLALVGYLAAAPAQKAEALVRWLEQTPELERLTYETLRGRHGLDEAAFDRAQAVATGDAEGSR